MTEASDGPVGRMGAREHAPGRANPTIRDVARASNVSIGTVSKALNNYGSMRPETRERIEPPRRPSTIGRTTSPKACIAHAR